MVEKARHPKPRRAVLARMRKAIAEEEQPEVIAANRQTGKQMKVSQTLKEVQNAVTASQQVLASLLKEKEAQQELKKVSGLFELEDQWIVVDRS